MKIPPMIPRDSSYHSRRGKMDRLAGKPLPPIPDRCRHSQDQCDYRMGWHAADVAKRVHPDWPDEFILY